MLVIFHPYLIFISKILLKYYFILLYSILVKYHHLICLFHPIFIKLIYLNAKSLN